MKNVTQSLLERQFLGNTVEAYLYCLLTIAIGIVLARVADRLLLRWLRRLTSKTENTWDDFLIQAAKRFLFPALYAVVIFLGVRDLILKASLVKGLHVIITALVTVQAVRLALSLANELLERLTSRRAETEVAREQEKRGIRGILAFVRIAAWSLALILVLDNLGVRVSTIVAGLGISGIAVALAAQAVLGDLFSYFVIFLDRPFQVGHSIKVGNFQGEVESIGLKTTRLRSLSGEQIVLSNKYLTDSQVLNYKVMSRRRAAVLFEVEYKTEEASLRSLPAMIREIVSGFSDVTFDRSHFKEFGESGLRFETVFFVETPEYGRYMDVLQDFNLRLKARLDDMGVALAFPARTVTLAKG